MEKTSLVLEAQPEGLTIGDLDKVTVGREEYRRQARQELIAQGYVISEKQGRTNVLRTVKPYRRPPT